MRNIRKIAGVVLILAIMGTGFAVKSAWKHAFDPTTALSDAMQDAIVAALFDEMKALFKAQVQTRILKEQDAQDAIRFWRTFTKYGSVSVLVVLLITTLLISAGLYHKFTTHLLTTKHSTIPFRGKIPPEIATGLVLAEQIEAQQPEKAIELYARMVEVNVKQLTALSRYHPTRLPLSLPDAAAQAPHAAAPDVPSFHDLLQSGELAPGKPMILGYEQGVPRRGSFLDIYSAAIAGESGSGKTGTLLFLIGSGLISQPIRFLAIDPHYPHPKSLGFHTKPLWEAGLITLAHSKDDMLNVLAAIEQTIDQRLKQIDTDNTPVVLVIDELVFLSTTSAGAALAHTMERISTEGRKCAVYMLASSQTWLAAKTGNSSVVRDTLTSAYVHRIKPKQANLLLQDKEEAEKVKHHVKHPGEALLVPVGDDSVLVTLPYTTAADMHIVAERMAHAPATAEAPARRDPATQPEPEEEPPSLPPTPFGLTTEYGLRTTAQTLYQHKCFSYGELEQATGISKSTAHAWINNPRKTLRPDQQAALRHYLEHYEHPAESPASSARTPFRPPKSHTQQA